jgi:hypothetical protein
MKRFSLLRKRFSLLSLGLLAVFVAAAAMATSAFAVQPSNLPTGVKAFTGVSEGETVYHGAEGDIKCPEASGTGEETSNEPPLGPFHIDFKGCNTVVAGVVVKCTGLGEATAGTILVLGTWHLVFDREVGHAFTGLTVASLFLVNTVHFTCSVLLLETKGEVLCLDLKPTENVAKHSFHCTGANATTANEEWCMGGEDVLGTESMCIGEWLLPKLEESVNHTPFKTATELALGNSTYGVAVAGMI